MALETLLGYNEVGKSADFIVLDLNTLELKPKDIKKTKVLMTILECEIVFDHNSQY